MLVIILTSMFVFVLFFEGLGDSPAVNACAALHKGNCKPAALAAIKKEMGLDSSVQYNYAIWAKGIFFGRDRVYADGKYYKCPAPCLGISIPTYAPVFSDLTKKSPATITLAVGGASIYVTLGVLMGATAARWRGTTLDRLLVGVTLVWSSLPDYV